MKNLNRSKKLLISIFSALMFVSLSACTVNETADFLGAVNKSLSGPTAANKTQTASVALNAGADRTLPKPSGPISEKERKALALSKTLTGKVVSTRSPSLGSGKIPDACQKYLRQVDACIKTQPNHATLLENNKSIIHDMVSSGIHDDAWLTEKCTTDMQLAELAYSCAPAK